VAVYFDTSRYRDSFARPIRVETNDPSHPNETLVCKARVLQATSIDENSVQFGVVERFGPSQYKTVTIRRGDGGPISPELLPIDNPAIEAQLCEIEPGEVYELEVSVGAPWPKGRFKETITFKTGVEEDPEKSITVTGGVQPRLTTAPRSFTFPAERPTQVERSVYLRWDSEGPGKILDIESSIPDSTVRVDEDDGKQEIVLVMPPGSDEGPRVHAVTMRTDDPEVPVYSVSVLVQPDSMTRDSMTFDSSTGQPSGKRRSNSGTNVKRTE